MTGSIHCLGTIAELRETVDEIRGKGIPIGLIPTMGALHAGHLSLIRAARSAGDFAVVSIFVNPAQFGANEDLERYPRDLRRDREMCEEAGAHLIFAPSEKEMYPEGYCTWVEVVGGLAAGLCGRARPGHFRGVCTVVTKLLNSCAPDRAYFGEKDAQQLAVITRMVRDLDMRVKIVSCPTVREADGLAMSSRNTRLKPDERAQAPVLFRALSVAARRVKDGELNAAAVDVDVRSILAEAPLGEIEYVEIVRADDLTPVTRLEGECLIALAVRFGDVRLIDNIRVTA